MAIPCQQKIVTMEEGQLHLHSKTSKSSGRKEAKRVNRRHHYKTESLSLALLAIKMGKLSLSKAALHYNIPKSTLRSRLKKRQPFEAGTGGASPSLSAASEAALAKWLTERHAIGATVGWPELAQTVHSLMCTAVTDMPSTSTNTNYNLDKKFPTNGWLVRFKRRHPDVPVLKSKLQEWFPSSLFSSQVMDEWITKLNQYLQSKNVEGYDLLSCEKSNRVYTVGTLTLSTKASLINSCFDVVIGQTEEPVSFGQLLLCYNSNGDYTKPLLVLDNSFHSSWQNMTSEERAVLEVIMAENSLIEENIFLYWLKLFLGQLDKSLMKPILVFLDKSVAHINKEALQLAEENGIILFCFPLHSEVKQPPYIGIMAGIKNTLQTSLAQTNKNSSEICSSALPLLVELYQQHSTLEQACSSFRMSGLVPISDHYAKLLNHPVAANQQPAIIDNNKEHDLVSNITNANSDIIKGMELALQVVEQRCIEKNYLPFYREFYATNTSPNCDPMYVVWRELVKEIELYKTGDGHTTMNLPTAATHSDETTSCLVSPSNVDTCQSALNSIPECMVYSNDVVPSSVSLRDCAPISDRYKRAFNFDVMPALNLEQHAMEIMEKYQAMAENTNLQQLVIDADTDFGEDVGGDVTVSDGYTQNTV